jgi:glycosyltransferase involved in cell wall biosynthesis
LVILEAWLQDCPVVASALPAVREFVTEDNAFLFPPEDVEALTQALDRALSDPLRAKARARRGHQVALDRFSPRVIAGQYSEIFHQLTS